MNVRKNTASSINIVVRSRSSRRFSSVLLAAAVIFLLGGSLFPMGSAAGQAASVGKATTLMAIDERPSDEHRKPILDNVRTVSYGNAGIGAGTSYPPPLRQTISLRLHDVGLEDALKHIATKADLRLAYLRETVDIGEAVTLYRDNITVVEVLQEVVRETGLGLYFSASGAIIVTPRSAAGSAPMDEGPGLDLAQLPARLPAAFARVHLQTGTVAGVVTDSTTGTPMPGVNVSVVGTPQGAATDVDGAYRITGVEEGTYSVQASFVGYGREVAENVRVEADQTTTLNFVMQPQATGLDEVVVVGYGTERRTDFTGSVSEVSSDDFERVPATNPLQSLQGRSPGLRIISDSGEPGAGASVRIRGMQSISGTNAPIYVVDGTITDNINHLDSGDIESVSVLKDASAAAIYGSRAANGVVLITTKRGANNEEPTIQLHTYGGMQQQSNLRLDLLDADQYLEIWTEGHENSGISTPWNEEDLAEYRGVNSDWRDAVMRPGYLVNTDLSVSGGSETSNYYVSAGRTSNRGMVTGLDYNRYNLRVNSDHQIRDWIEFGESLNIYSSNRNDGDGQYVYSLQKVPITRIYEEDGTWGRIRNTPLEHMHANPLWMAENVRERTNRGLMGNLYLTLSLLDGLEFTTRGNVEWANHYRTNFTQGVPQGLGWEGGAVNQLEKDNRETLHWTTDFLLDYERSFGPNHRVNSLLGYSVEEQTYERLQSEGTETPSDEIRFLSAADPTSIQSDNTYSDWAFQSMFGRVGYTFMDRYILNGTLRRDGTSRLAEEHQYGIFPSISAAWRMSEEGFMDGVDWLDELKLRGSWGTLGNVMSVSTYGTKTSFTNWNYVFNQEVASGYTLASAVNTGLVWESTTKKNIGIDAELLGDRVSVMADYFIDDTYDLLFRQPIPMSTGLSGSPFNNAGQIRNTGIEFDLGFQQTSGDWQYSFNVNMTHFKNEVIDLEGRDLRTSGIVKGHPLNSYFGYRTNGLIRTEDDLNNHPHYPGKEIGDIWLLDIDGRDAEGNLTGQPDGVVDEADRTLLGDRFADVLYGAMGTIGYKNLTLQVQLQGVQGILKDIRTGTQGVSHYMTSLPQNHAAFILDRYHPEKNPEGEYPRVTIDDAGSTLMASDFWLDDASYLRISNLNLSYDFPDSFNRRVAVGNVQAYASVQNLYTLTGFYGPEVDSNVDALTGVPQPRTWTMGVRLSF